MEGQLSEHPLAELIREIAATGLSGALRLARERAKVAIYFQDGELVFAVSNLRAHRLREIVKQGGLSDAQLSDLPAKVSDDELSEALVESGRVTAETLAMIRSKQLSDVLRLALLWTDGTWEFDPRVRVANDVSVSVDVNRLLLECARHLQTGFVASRFCETNGITYQSAPGKDATNLLPAEASVFSRASRSVQLSELSGLRGASKEDNLRAVYALSLSGLLQPSDWPGVLGGETSKTLYKREGACHPSAEPKEKPPTAERAEASFRQGLAALHRNQRDLAIRLLAEAAMLAPREARYRANYGHALIGETNARRVAESELQAALALEPDNASHRVMLAELYQTLGLRRRAQGEAERALATDPKNEAAQALLTSLRNLS